MIRATIIRMRNRTAVSVDPDTSQVLLTELVVEAKPSGRRSASAFVGAGRRAARPRRDETAPRRNGSTRSKEPHLGNFRQFSVTTVESIGDPAGQR